MKLLTLLLALTACSAPAPAESLTTTAPCRIVDGRADAHCTPGALNPDVTQENISTTICVPGWTKTIRPPASYTNALKRQQMARYGLTGPPSGFEEDHLIPLEVGGAPEDPDNLFPQPIDAAHLKDLDENRVHRDVCAGRMTLEQGRQWFKDRWTR